MPRKIRRLLPVAFAAALATSGFAYMANNTVDPSNAGLGSQTISGYDVHNIKYTSDNAAVDPKVTQVTFTLSHTTGADASSAYAEIGGVQSSACTVSTGTWTCTWASANQQKVAAASSLTVLAYQ